MYTTIKVEDKEVGIHFGYDCAKRFFVSLAYNKEAYLIGDDLTQMGFARLLNYAYVNNCALKDLKPVLNIDHFYKWVSDNVIVGEENAEAQMVLSIWLETKETQDVLGKFLALAIEKKSPMKKQSKKLSSIT